MSRIIGDKYIIFVSECIDKARMEEAVKKKLYRSMQEEGSGMGDIISIIKHVNIIAKRKLAYTR